MGEIVTGRAVATRTFWYWHWHWHWLGFRFVDPHNASLPATGRRARMDTLQKLHLIRGAMVFPRSATKAPGASAGERQRRQRRVRVSARQGFDKTNWENSDYPCGTQGSHRRVKQSADMRPELRNEPIFECSSLSTFNINLCETSPTGGLPPRQRGWANRQNACHAGLSRRSPQGEDGSLGEGGNADYSDFVLPAASGSVPKTGPNAVCETNPF